MKHLIFLFTVLYLNGIHGYENVNPPLTNSYRKCDTQNGLCSTCTDNESLCGFEKKNEKSYYGCIEKGKEFHCCPSGYSYNNNTRDVTCIEEGEELEGHGAEEATIDHLNWKFCSDHDYPSCKNKSKTKIQHTCSHISKPCNGVCYAGYQIDKSKKVCAKNNTYVPSVNFQSCTEGNQCPCNDNQQPCRFNGYPGLNYQGCIQIGNEKNCCPPGFKYNPNSLDVTCIGENEQLENGTQNDNWKWCPNSDYPSCREKVEEENESGSFYIHICRGPNQKCRHHKFFPGGNYQSCGTIAKPAFNAFCLRTGTCKPGRLGSEWTCKNNNNNISGHDLTKRFGEIDEPELTNATGTTDNKNTIIITASSLGAAFFLSAITIAGIVYYKRRQRQNVERVDDNPDYDYGEIYDNIEITDFNPYYMENGEDEEDGKAEIVDHNPLYGVGEDDD